MSPEAILVALAFTCIAAFVAIAIVGAGIGEAVDEKKGGGQ